MRAGAEEFVGGKMWGSRVGSTRPMEPTVVRDWRIVEGGTGASEQASSWKESKKAVAIELPINRQNPIV